MGLAFLEWVDGLNATIDLPVAQIFRQDFIATASLSGSNNQRIVKLNAITPHDPNRTASPFWENGGMP